MPIKELCMLVCLLACLLFIGHTTFVHFAALPPSTPRAAKPSRAAPCARGQAHAQRREHAPACRTTSQRKNRCADAFQKQNRTRAHAVVYVTAEIFQKKGKRKPTCHFPSSVYNLPSLRVFTFRIVLNRILHKSSLLAPMESFVISHSHISFYAKLLAGRDFVLDLWSEPTLVSSFSYKSD